MESETNRTQEELELVYKSLNELISGKAIVFKKNNTIFDLSFNRKKNIISLKKIYVDKDKNNRTIYFCRKDKSNQNNYLKYILYVMIDNKFEVDSSYYLYFYL